MAGLKVDRARAESAVRELLAALGFDPESAELAETPDRVVSAYSEELLRGYAQDPADWIARGSEPVQGPIDPVVLDGIDVVTVCPHHLMVAEGRATVAYLPGELLLGLGTLARVVDALSRRLILQEKIAGEIVDALMVHAGARAAFCRIELRHACLRSRGPEQHRAEAVSFASRGEWSDPRVLGIALGRALDSTEARGVK